MAIITKMLHSKQLNYYAFPSEFGEAVLVNTLDRTGIELLFVAIVAIRVVIQLACDCLCMPATI